ncbi:cytochrome-c peroxidase [Parasalinivibrio latis]|uniref:cytochrome-c peroxidase n=1 Tax=Parasalinivibrio latis TaxID=2952610 RepID=UPI0030E038C1
MGKLKLLIGLGAVGYLSTVAYVHYDDNLLTQKRLTGVDTHSMTPLTRQVYGIVADKGCEYCHSKNSEMPFYANLPVAKQLMEHDIDQGLRHFRIEPVLAAMRSGKPITDTDLAKIESVMEEGSMPPALYLTMHWAADMSQQERDTVLNWVTESRTTQHPRNPASPAFKNEAVQPVYTTFRVNEDKVKLGDSLYHDTRLSGDNTVSCASCHSLSHGGVDGLKTSTGVGGAKGPINAPTVYNAVFNIHQFWDGRAKDLQAQAGGPPLNPIEMASTSWKQIIDKLDQDPAMQAQFTALYPDGITAGNITDAIAEFEKTLTTPNSRFDQYLKGNANALTKEEQEGYALFKSNKCDTCHAGEAMGGQTFEVMGLKADYFADRGNPVKVDNGRYNVTGDQLDMHRFKVPTLRNVALTAPYFHDASAQTLEQAVADMAKYQVGVTLSQSEVDKITAYLKTLTGEYNGKPLG